MSFLPRLGRRRESADSAGDGASPRAPEIPGALRRGRETNGAGGNGAGARSGAPDRRALLKKQATELPVSVLGWLDERAGASPMLRAFMFRKVPKGINWFYTLGSAAMFAFIAQAVTGVFLAMYYVPSADEAYESASYITNEVFLGELVRGMHRWGATVMVVLVFLHMGRTFFFGAYKYPRELNWVIGVVLLILTMAMGFTGYLLPFDQRSYWATIVGVNINASGPILGPYLADFLRAGPEFTATTLPRFYAIHMMLLPGLIAALIGAHLYLVTKLGITAPPWLKAEKRRELAREKI